MNVIKRSLCVLLLLLFGVGIVSADNRPELESILNDTAEYIYQTVQNPQVGSIGGEWAVLGLARSGYEIPEAYYQAYYQTVEDYVKACDGKLHNKKYTEYSRVIVALTAIGKNPADVAGYNLLTPLGDYEKTIWQGMNGPIWALIALDSGNYEIPENPEAKTQATRELYLKRILDCQLPDGGWSLFGGTSAATSGNLISDPDITGMALQALASYQKTDGVKAAIDKALKCMSNMQDETGGFSAWNTKNSESCVQMIVALCALGIPIDDPRFVKNGNTILDHLLTYYAKGNSFRHTHEGSGSNLMATEQGFYGIVAVDRMKKGKNSLYHMSDALVISEAKPDTGIVGLPDKHPDVQKMELLFPGKTFSDISTHENQPAMEALAARNIVNGVSENSFLPDNTMTRAEFAAIIVKGLGLPEKSGMNFSDVTETDWFFRYVNTAYAYGIIKGISETMFHPNGTITREEAAVMTARAAKLCGMDTEVQAFAVRDILAGFLDYVKASDWAMSSLAFCYREEILSEDVLEIHPKEAVTRAEISKMLFQMLSLAKLL